MYVPQSVHIYPSIYLSYESLSFSSVLFQIFYIDEFLLYNGILLLQIDTP